MKIFILKLISSLLIVHLICFPAMANNNSESKRLDLNKIVLPSEVKKLNKSSGAVYYNQSVKGKVLVPVHFWGEFVRPGLHFVPADSKLISGISMAGGPRTTGILETVKLTRTKSDNSIKEFEFNLAKGGELNAHRFVLEEGDTVFIEKSTSNEDRSFYLNLVSVAITVITTFIVVQKIDDNRI